MIYTVEQIRQMINPIAAAYEVSALSLFGSYARGMAKEESDIDLIVDRGKVNTAFQMGGLYADLQERLQKELDLVTRDYADPDFLHSISREEIHLYP